MWTITASVQLGYKNSGRVSHGACLQASRRVTLTLALTERRNRSRQKKSDTEEVRRSEKSEVKSLVYGV
jgi:hypothetical protein